MSSSTLFAIIIVGIFLNLDKYFQYRISKDHFKNEKRKEEFGYFKSGHIEQVKDNLPKKILRFRLWIVGENGDWQKAFRRNKK